MEDTDNGRCVSHSGDGRGINSQFRSCLDCGYTLVVLSNTDPPTASIIGDLWRDLLLTIG